MNCPKCNVLLSMMERQGVEIDYCPQCRGVWLDRGELDKIIERTAPAAAPAPAATAPAPSTPGGPPPLPLPRQGEYRRRRDDDDDDDDHYRQDSPHGKRKKKGFFGDLFDF